MTNRPLRRGSLPADLVDLRLQVADHLRRHVVAQDLEQVDGLRAGNGLVRGQLHALLDLLDLRVLRYQVRALGLSDGLVREYRALFAAALRHRQARGGHGARAQNRDARERFHGSENGEEGKKNKKYRERNSF